MSAPTVSVVVVSYNTRDLLRRCLRSVLAEAGDGQALEVLVVDNASADGSAAMAREEFPAVRLRALDENLGFARAVNLASEDARGAFLLMVNPDAELRPGTVAALVALARARPEGGVYGGRSVADDGRLDPRSCWGLPTVWSLFCFATGLSTLFPRSRVFDPESLGRWPRDSVREVGAVSGSLMLVPRPVWEELGGFDPTYFMYSEDFDLCVRARGAGYHPMITPDASIVHAGGGSSPTHGAKTVLVLRGKATFVRRHWSPARRRLGVALLVAGTGTRALAARAARVAGSQRGSWWLDAWNRRAHWVGGYPAVTP